MIRWTKGQQSMKTLGLLFAEELAYLRQLGTWLQIEWVQGGQGVIGKPLSLSRMKQEDTLLAPLESR
jgi:hypothetical protein